jgi:hypothetical protein
LGVWQQDAMTAARESKTIAGFIFIF